MIYNVFCDIRGYVQDSRRIPFDYFNINNLLHFQLDYWISKNPNDIILL